MCTRMFVARGVLTASTLFRLFQKFRQSPCCLMHHASAASCNCSGTPRSSFSQTLAAQLDRVRLFSRFSSITLRSLLLRTVFLIAASISAILESTRSHNPKTWSDFCKWVLRKPALKLELMCFLEYCGQ